MDVTPPYCRQHRVAGDCGACALQAAVRRARELIPVQRRPPERNP